ncbi:hypothetical protein PC110_g13284 [Phytophthora cactorum]|uniref:Uncharacterized protein n=1 Tax=Phytophthora cactorum TaxID=29920 RepID=A0A329S3Y5_9STRA|nr:hypothetical protein PC110_g13284 [Phytophthora cactorum]
MEFIVLVAVENLDHLLNPDEVLAVSNMVKILQQLLNAPSLRRLECGCHQLQTYLLKVYEIPADMVESFKTQVFGMLVDLEKLVRTVPHHKIRKNFVLINELLEGHCATWNPYNESDIGKLLATIQRFCSEEYGTEWNHSFMSICRACRKMNGSTFVWMADLASEPPKAFSRTWDELRFTDEAVVKESFVHVTSFEEQARHATEPSEKLKSFAELIDRLQWFLNGVVGEKDQSLLFLQMLTQLNECMNTLAGLCDRGKSLTLERCLYLEKLVCIVRQSMYMREDELKTLVTACNEIGVLICDLSRQVSSAGTDDASPSATDDEEDMTAEPKKKKKNEAMTVEKKKAAKTQQEEIPIYRYLLQWLT